MLPRAGTSLPCERDVAFAGAVEPQLFGLLRNVFPFHFQQGVYRQFAVLLDGVGSSGQNMSRPASDFGPRRQQQRRTFLDRLVFVHNQLMHRESVAHSQAITVHAHSQRTIEAEELRTWRLIAHSALSAGVVGAVKTIR